MALNFSHRPMFPAHLSEDNLVSPMRIANSYLVEGIPDKNGDGFSKQWHSNRDMEDCFDYGRDRGDTCGSQESVSKDILDLLPSDPFGMDISTTFTAITGWLQDLEVDYGGYGRSEVCTSDVNYELFAGLNLIWNNAMGFHGFSGSMELNHKSDLASGFGGWSKVKDVGEAFCHRVLTSDCDVDEILSFGNENTSVVGHKSDFVSGFGGCSKVKEIGEASCHHAFTSDCDVDDILSFGNENTDIVDCTDQLEEVNEICPDGDGGATHAAFNFGLAYLGVRDLLVVEKVCRTLRSTVQTDPLLWRSIHINQPLNEKITDDALLQLTNRAQGNLQCLSLVECPRVTDEGLKCVLESNPRLTKLSVPGCTRISIEGIVSSLKALKSMGAPGVKHLRIGGLYGVTERHFEDLMSLLGTDEHIGQNARKPHFYHRGNFYLSCDDDRAIDIEMCPRCLNLRLVYDCPAEGCQGKGHSTQSCRACTLCIPRCVQCGRCINDSEYEETFCLELLCSDCLMRSQERQDRIIGPSRSIAHHESSGLYLHG